VADLSPAELDELATLVARFDTELSHELEGMLETWAEQNAKHAADFAAINPRGTKTPEQLRDLATRIRHARSS
jgi:hypothetical protein